MFNGIISGLTLVCLFSFPTFTQTSLPAPLRPYLSANDWNGLSPARQQTLLDLHRFAATAPEDFGSVSPPCYHYQTAPEAALLLEGVHEQLLEDFAPAAADRFYTLRRWESGSYLATPGSSTLVGDPVTITWSYLPDGTGLELGCNTNTAAPSDLIHFLTTIFGGGPAVPGDYTTAPWHPTFVAAFAEWETRSGLHFVYEPNDDGAPAADPDLHDHAYGQLGVRGDIRIGGRSVDGAGGILACAQFPYNGEIIFDTNDSYYGNEVNADGSVSDAFFNIIAHEIGHALGVLHHLSANHQELMEPYVQNSFRGLQHAGELAANHYYGDRYENGITPTPLPLADLTTGVNLSLDAATDVDHYLIAPEVSSTLTLAVTPRGLTNYSHQSSISQPSQTVNTTANAALRLRVFNAATNTLLATSSGGGGQQQLTLYVQAGLSYRLVVDGTFSAATDPVRSIQLYQLDATGVLLPVEWTSFTGAALEPGINQLSWSTATERKAAYYAVERSTDGSTFTELDRVAAGGDSDTERFYRYSDRTPTGALHYYRLRQVDTDGTYAYSKTIVVRSAVAEAAYRLFPNPVAGEFYLVRRAAAPRETVQLYDALGRLVRQFDWAANRVRLDVPVRGLLPGNYTARITGGRLPRVLRWTKQ